MDNQKFNKFFKVGYVSLLVLVLLVTVWYLVAASNKDCLACTLSICETIGPDGESYMLPADSCALPYEEIVTRERQQGIDITECSQECISYSGSYMTFAMVLVILALGLTIIMAVYSSFANSKKMSKTTIIVAAFAILSALIAFLLSSNTIPEILGYEGVISLFEVKLTDTLLYATYILLGGAIVAILSSVVIKYLRK